MIVLSIYAYFNIMTRKQDFVQCVEAGPTCQINADNLNANSFYDKHRIVKKKNGDVVDTSKMIRIIVKGNCMKPKQIESGSQLLVLKLDAQRPVKEQIKSGDILLIHLKDTNIHKIRVFDKYENGVLQTYRFDDNGQKKKSSKPHQESSVIGVVKYKL